MKSGGCPFCAIARGEAPACTVVEDEGFVGFLDARPVFPGHVLVVPRDHVPTLAELDPARAGALLANVQRVMGALERALGAEGTFVGVNNKVSQSVLHLHVHVVPRRKTDGLRGFFWPRHPYADEETMRSTAAAIRAALG